MKIVVRNYDEEVDDGSYLVVSRGGDQAPQAPVMAGNETAWKTPTMIRTATARYRLALTQPPQVNLSSKLYTPSLTLGLKLSYALG